MPSAVYKGGREVDARTRWLPLTGQLFVVSGCRHMSGAQ